MIKSFKDFRKWIRLMINLFTKWKSRITRGDEWLCRRGRCDRVALRSTRRWRAGRNFRHWIRNCEAIGSELNGKKCRNCMISPLPVEETFDQLVNAATILIGSVFVQEVVVQQDAVFLHATQTAVQVDHLLVSRHGYPERHVEVLCQSCQLLGLCSCIIWAILYLQVINEEFDLVKVLHLLGRTRHPFDFLNFTLTKVKLCQSLSFESNQSLTFRDKQLIR